MVCHTVQLNLPCYIDTHSSTAHKQYLTLSGGACFGYLTLFPMRGHVDACHMPGPLMVPTAYIRIAILYKINVIFRLYYIENKRVTDQKHMPIR